MSPFYAVWISKNDCLIFNGPRNCLANGSFIKSYFVIFAFTQILSSNQASHESYWQSSLWQKVKFIWITNSEKNSLTCMAGFSTFIKALISNNFMWKKPEYIFLAWSQLRPGVTIFIICITRQQGRAKLLSLLFWLFKYFSINLAPRPAHAHNQKYEAGIKLSSV